jgi:hypothetical protein
MILDPMVRKENRQATLAAAKENMTKAQRVHRQFVSGKPPVSEFRTPAEAIRAASVLLQGLKSAMGATESEDDVRVGLVYVDTSFTMAVVRRYLPDQEKRMVSELTGQPIIVIGLVFVIVDRNRKDKTTKDYISVGGMKPFFVTKQVIGWLQDVITRTNTVDMN